MTIKTCMPISSVTNANANTCSIASDSSNCCARSNSCCQSLSSNKTASSWSDRENPNVIVLFDVDGTLTPSRKTATSEMISILEQLRKKVVIGFVGGSDLIKQKEQLGENCVELFDFAFSENGANAYKKGAQISNESFLKYLGEENYSCLVNYLLRYIADLEIPKKRGTFIELRNAMVNVSPIGRNCSYEERLEFEAYDREHKIREKLCKDLNEMFPKYRLKYSIGGQISIDIFPQGWDKTFCLRHLEHEGFNEIHFFGDMTHQGGNDYEIFNHPIVIGHATKNPQDTINQLNKLFFNN